MPYVAADEMGRQLCYNTVEAELDNTDSKPALQRHHFYGKVTCILVTFGVTMLAMLAIANGTWPGVPQHAVPLRNLNGTAPASKCKPGVPGNDIPGWGCDSFSQKHVLCRRKCLVDCASICAQCFPSSVSVSVLLEQRLDRHRSTVAVVERRMDQLQVGDLVLTASGFSKIFAFMDHNRNAKVEVLNILTAAGREVSLTADHIIFAHKDRQPVLAGSLTLGDILWHGMWEGVHAVDIKPIPVVQISRQSAHGMHAPLTEEGSMLVNGMLTSSYASVETMRWGSWPVLTGHDAARLVHRPLQWWCALKPSACGPSKHMHPLGRHAFTQFILDRFDWLHALNAEHSDLQAAVFGGHATTGTWAAALMQLVAALSLFAFHALLCLVDSILTPQHLLTLVVCLACKWMFWNLQGKFAFPVLR